MTAAWVFVIASQGPFGPTAWTFLLLPLLLIGPFVLLALAARSLLGADPVSPWLLALLTLGTGYLGFLLWPAKIVTRWSGFWGVWGIAAIACVVLLPAVAFIEAGKRDFFRRPPSRSVNSSPKRPPRGAPSPPRRRR